MKEQFKVLQDSLKLTAKNIQFVAETTGGEKGLLLTSCVETIQAQMKMIEYLSTAFENEKAIKNRCFSFLGDKGLMNEFYSK